VAVEKEGAMNCPVGNCPTWTFAAWVLAAEWIYNIGPALATVAAVVVGVRVMLGGEELREVLGGWWPGAAMASGGPAMIDWLFGIGSVWPS
jgi:hypothetical protein